MLVSPTLLITLSRLSSAISPGWPGARVLTLSEPCFHIRSMCPPCSVADGVKWEKIATAGSRSESALPPLHHQPPSHALSHTLTHRHPCSLTLMHSHTQSQSHRHPHIHSYTLTLVYSKSLTYKGVSFQERVHKSSLFISPTKLA